MKWDNHSRFTAKPGIYVQANGGSITCHRHLGAGDMLTHKMGPAEEADWRATCAEEGWSPCEACPVAAEVQA